MVRDVEHGSGPAGVRTAAGSGVRRGPDALRAFRRDLDAVLDQLRASAARPAGLAALDLPRRSLSGTATPFAEADGLHGAYAGVHRQLVSAVEQLDARIEAVGIAVHGVDVGFENLELDLRERFWRIHADTTAHARPGEARP
ncbi:hypothetical protein [Streptomyces sp. NPDC060194]|uniref:hypothetical protein n=1 Tax=Streptomyces sp. NPDC060194 TaxID=3347069 RepID=UPI0036553B88